MTKRKTVDIEAIRAEANKVFRESKPEWIEGRKAIQTFVEQILMDAGQYNGFNYLYASDLPEGWTPGIIFDESPARDHKFPDPSRIYFY